jgi:integrase
MPQAKITKRTVDAAKAGERNQFLWDDEVHGFGLKVTPAGGKVYVFQYRLARPGMAELTPPARWTIGRHGKLTPEQARKEAKRLAALVEQGLDPRKLEADRHAAEDEAKRQAAERARIETELAFSRMADLWLTHYETEKGRRPSSVALAKLVVSNHLKPALTSKPLPHIGRAELQPIIDAIPAHQKGMRRAVFAYASVLFGWAVMRGEIPANPLLAMLKPEAPKARDRVLTDRELAAIWTAAGGLNNPFPAFYRLLILTGQRRSEVAGLQWSELDRSTATWTIPPARTKNGKAHVVPLPEQAVQELDRLAGGDKWPQKGFALSTTGKTAISGMSKAKASLDAGISKLPEGQNVSDWRVHDLRRTVATGLQRLGVRFEVTEAVLNHVGGSRAGVAGIYQRHDWKDEKRAALEAWGRHIAALLNPAGGDNVVRLKQKRDATA